MKALLVAWVCAFGLLTGSCVRAEEQLAPATIVLYNAAAPDSAELAKLYAQKRGIARDHVVALDCPVDEEISREQYDTTIATPLRELFEQRAWWTTRPKEGDRRGVVTNSIRFVALIRGVPLKIRAATDYAGDQVGAGPINNRNEASVDSELACLGMDTRQISGALQNPYFQSYRPIGELNPSSLMLVSRLDGPSTAAVKRMILETIEAEKTGLWGRAFVDGAHNTAGGLAEGDRWLADIVSQLHQAGVPVVYDDTVSLFPDGFPVTDCALYYGWYAQDFSGAFTQPGFRFRPGSIAVHIHSFSAATLRNAKGGWTGPLVEAGAAASMGNVYEPYLQLTSHLDVFNDRLLHGFTLAESAYMSLRVLSWMSVVVGDPLYRPYGQWIQLDKPDTGKQASEWKQYRDFAVKNASRPPADYRKLARQVASRSRNGAMIEDLGLMEGRDGNYAAAAGYFQQARTCYSKRDDILRVVFEESEVLTKQGKTARALELVRSVLRIVSEAPSSELLRKLERDLAGAGPMPPK